MGSLVPPFGHPPRHRAKKGKADVKKSAIERFMGRVIPEPNSGCWLWTGGTNGVDGYGAFYANGRMIPAHRFILQHLGVEIPDGLFSCHRCNVKSCCNPAHLYVADNQTNLQDAARDGLMANQNVKKKKCPKCDGDYTIRKNGYRFCRHCKSIAGAKHYRRTRDARLQVAGL